MGCSAARKTFLKIIRNFMSVNSIEILVNALLRSLWWGLYHKTFYGRNCCHIKISQSVCKSHSLPPQSNIWRQGWSLPEWNYLHDSTLMVGSKPCPQVLDQGVSVKHSAYQDAAIIMAVRIFIVQVAGFPMGYCALVRLLRGNIIR